MADYVNIPMSVAVDTVALTTTVAGNLVIGGEVPVLQSKTVYPSASDQAIEPDTGYDALDEVDVMAVVVTNLSAANIVDGVTVKVGDANDDDSIASVTGTAQTGIVPTGTLELTSNGTENCSAYEYVDVDVANSYTAGDEGKVVRSGALVSQTSATYTQNSTYDTTTVNSVTVQVEGGGSATLGTKTISNNGTYKAEDDSLDGYSQVTVSVPASAVDSGTKSITANGNNQDVVGYAAVNVNVPNSYSAGDEGKVVSSGALVAQTAHADVTPTTSDQTIDTTTNNSIKVKGDADLVAANIKKDVEIFGVTGSYEGGGGISADDIATGNVPSTLSLATTTLSLPDAFAYWPMTNISAPNLQTISRTYAFAYCQNLGTVKFPELTTISENKVFAYSGGTDLNNTNCILVFPKLALGNVRATFDRGYFDTIDIGPNTTNFYGDTFYHNTGDQIVKKLIIRKADAVVSASTTGAIIGLRDVYIPKTMYDHLGDGTALDYQAATNWVTQYNAGKVAFHSIEGTAYDGYWADGTPIT